MAIGPSGEEAGRQSGIVVLDQLQVVEIRERQRDLEGLSGPGSRSSTGGSPACSRPTSRANCRPSQSKPKGRARPAKFGNASSMNACARGPLNASCSRYSPLWKEQPAKPVGELLVPHSGHQVRLMPRGAGYLLRRQQSKRGQESPEHIHQPINRSSRRSRTYPWERRAAANRSATPSLQLTDRSSGFMFDNASDPSS
jgi:hypothetical protein